MIKPQFYNMFISDKIKKHFWHKIKFKAWDLAELDFFNLFSFEFPLNESTKEIYKIKYTLK